MIELMNEYMFDLSYIITVERNSYDKSIFTSRQGQLFFFSKTSGTTRNTALC